MNGYPIRKYCRTPHLEGSRLQPGDEDLSQISFAQIAGRRIVVEEKCDGANTAISFDRDGTLLLQSRGHYLNGGEREKHYDLFKQWAVTHQTAFSEVLGRRYIMYGEWMYAKHSIYYDALPHYFLEFDLWDRETETYLDTPSRRAVLSGLPVASVPVITQGTFTRLSDVTKLIGPSQYIKSGQLERLRDYCTAHGEDAAARCAETDPAVTMEGLYIKVEERGQVVDRMKYVRQSFLQCAVQPDTSWLSRPIIPNGLCRPLEELFSAALRVHAGTEYDHG